MRAQNISRWDLVHDDLSLLAAVRRQSDLKPATIGHGEELGFQAFSRLVVPGRIVRANLQS
jgi:hypothetical protein